MRAYPPADVVAGEVRLDALRELIAGILAAMPVAAGECTPLAAKRRYSTLGAQLVDPSPSPGGQEVAGLALAGGAVWLGVCGGTLGVVCPVASPHHFQLATDVTLPNGAKHTVSGNATTVRWKASAWSYRKARDEAFAAGLADALLAMAKAYAAALQSTLSETP